jgi:hypothetical protein
MRRVRQRPERVEIGDEPDLAHRAHAGNRLQLVEAVHRLHRDGEPDPGLEPALEAVPRRRLGANRAVVAAPEEADEAETRLVHALCDLLRGHVSEIVGVQRPPVRQQSAGDLQSLIIAADRVLAGLFVIVGGISD